MDLLYLALFAVFVISILCLIDGCAYLEERP